MSKTKIVLLLQTLILASGTAFAWYQWYMEYFEECDTCTGKTGQLFTKCFLGALFFTVALILNIVLVLKHKN